MATSTSSGSSYSNSEPTFLETPENALIDQLSNVAAGLAQQMSDWASQQFAKTSQITDQAVGNFFQVSQKMLGFSQGLTDQYNNLFAPENAQLVADANSYASPERMQVNMGMAGATQAQAGEAAIRNSERDLLSYGIDPSSGRYAALDEAGKVQNAANVAGAENMQRNQDIATGQRLRSEAVQVGSQLPAAIANTANTAIQANTGASNAELANANTGANMKRVANDYLKTAMDIKLPPTGQRTTGGSQQSSNSNSPDRDHNNDGSGSGRGRGGPGDGGGGGGGNGPAWMPNHGGGRDSGGGYNGNAVSRGNPSAGIMHLPDQPDSGVYGYDQPDADFGYLDNEYGFGDISGGQGSVGQQMFDPTDYGGSNPFNDSGFGQTYDYGGPNQTYGGLGDMQNSDMGLGNYTYDTAANNANPGWDQTYDQTPAWPDQSSGGGGGDNSAAFDNYGGGGDLFGANYGDGYAGGGQVVPPQASPSRGQRQDDVRANVNVGEFIVPEDVARWKGAEFFHNLIDKSRKARTMSPVGGRPMPQGDPRAQGRPTFQTR